MHGLLKQVYAQKSKGGGSVISASRRRDNARVTLHRTFLTYRYPPPNPLRWLRPTMHMLQLQYTTDEHTNNEPTNRVNPREGRESASLRRVTVIIPNVDLIHQESSTNCYDRFHSECQSHPNPIWAPRHPYHDRMGSWPLITRGKSTAFMEWKVARCKPWTLW